MSTLPGMTSPASASTIALTSADATDSKTTDIIIVPLENDARIDDVGVVEPDSLQKTGTRVLKVPTLSRKGQRAFAACLLSVAVIAAAGVVFGLRWTHSGNNDALEGPLVDICSATLYPDTCSTTLIGANLSSPKSYVSQSMSASMTSANSTLLNLTACLSAWPGTRSGMQYSTLQMCVNMYRDVVSAVGTSLFTVEGLINASANLAELNDLEQRTSAALTYHFTCMSGLQEQGLWLDGTGRAICGIDMERTTELLSNALSLVDRFNDVNDTAVAGPSRRRLLDAEPEESPTHAIKSPRRMLLYEMDEENQERFPKWLRKSDRRLLQSTANNTVTLNCVVALDGSGNFTSIQTAVDRAPSNSSERYVIHIRSGTYNERVTVPGSKLRLTFVGDGPGATIITGNVSSMVNNVTTSFTATVTIQGDYFIAKNLTIRNTAGPDGHQAVALRVTSQQSAFTWLSIEGYQDTLYTHTSQQFYSYCTILGTIDFVFGSAAAVFQNCSLQARLPNPGQTITFTASGIASPIIQQRAGLVFHTCSVDATPELRLRNSTTKNANFAAFLGRPWRVYARTTFLKCQLGELVDPQGWTLWNKNVSSASHVEYAEFANFGPGASYLDRVSWSQQLNPVAALDYGVDRFLKGNLWLPAMNISYSPSI